MDKTFRRLVLVSALFLASTSVTLKAQDPSSSPEVQRVVQKYEAALGGRAQVRSIRTREIQGTFEYRGVQQHATGLPAMRWRAPSSLVQQLRGPMGVVTRGFDGAAAWGSHPQTGVRRLSSFEIDEIIVDGALYQLFGVRHWYGELAYEGRTRVGDRDAEVLSAARHGTRVDRFYFDVATGLPVQLDVWEEGPEAIRSGNSGQFYLAHYQLDDYRMVDGVAVPLEATKRGQDPEAHNLGTNVGKLRTLRITKPFNPAAQAGRRTTRGTRPRQR